MTKESRLDARRYNLSDKQFSFLARDDSGTRKSSDVEKEIPSVIENLAPRLQYLVEDIAILEKNDLLNESNWPDAWDDLTDIERNDRMYNEPAQVSWPVGANSDVIEKYEYIKLAIHLGHVARLLYQNLAPTYDQELVGMGLLMGLEGSFLRDHEGGATPDADGLSEVDAGKSHLRFQKPPEDGTLEELEDLMATLQSYLNRRATPEIGPEGLREQMEKSDITLTNSLENEARRRYRNPDYGGTAYDVETLAQNLGNDADLQRIEELANQIQSDLKTLTETNYLKGVAIDVFYTFYDQGKFTEVPEVIPEADTKGQQVKKFRTDFLGREPPWSDRPLLEEEEDIGYSPTDYGTLIGDVLSYTGFEDVDDPSDYSPAATETIVKRLHMYYFGNKGEEKQDLINSVLGNSDDSNHQVQGDS